MRRLSFALGAIAMTGATPASARNDGEEIRIDYIAPDGCPSQTEFESRVLARTSRVHFVPPGTETRVFEVRLEVGPPARGRVTVLRARSTRGVRDVQADTCSDVADALALVVALAVDPDALTTYAAPAPAVVPPPIAAHAPPPPAPEPSVVPRTEDRPRALESRVRPTSAPLPAPVRAAPRSFSLGTDLSASSGTAPTLLVGFSAHVGWQSPAKAAVVSSLRLGFFHATTEELTLPGGAASFASTAGQLDACATAWPGAAARISACARVQAGVLNATGADVAAPRSQTRGRVDVGPAIRVEWTLVAPLYIEAELGAVLHAIADRFYFLPDTTAFHMPLLGFCGSGGVGAHFL